MGDDSRFLYLYTFDRGLNPKLAVVHHLLFGHGFAAQFATHTWKKDVDIVEQVKLLIANRAAMEKSQKKKDDEKESDDNNQSDPYQSFNLNVLAWADRHGFIAKAMELSYDELLTIHSCDHNKILLKGGPELQASRSKLVWKLIQEFQVDDENLMKLAKQQLVKFTNKKSDAFDQLRNTGNGKSRFVS